MPTSPRRSKRRFSSSSIGTTIWDKQVPMVTSSQHEGILFQDASVQPLTYASLPPTPILPSPPARSPSPAERGPPLVSQSHQKPLFSLWDYLREELLATDFDSHQELKWERVSNFLSIPLATEKIIGFGFLLCLDSFLYSFTIQPIRFFIACSRSIYNFIFWSKSPLPPSQKADILRTMLVIISIALLIPLADASKIYHSIRGQDTIKLYVIFNSLEIADRLCASIGQDILDCLFSRSTLEALSHIAPISSHLFRPLIFFVLATLYVVCHTLVMLYQLLSLNVAVNSYDHALLTLLVSNQFVEIKGCVFKKFEKDNLFQITCADIVERFTLSLMLVVVAFRNLIELSGSEFDFAGGFVMPKSFGWFRGNNVLWTISYPVVTVLISEMMVDWLKHAFITKFNHIRPSVYERYIDVLCRDLATASVIGRHGARKHTYVDQSPLVARRLGFASVPLAVLAILIGLQSFHPILSRHLCDQRDLHSFAKWIAMGMLFWLCFLALKVLLGVNLISYAGSRKTGMEARAEADRVNDFGRHPIGEDAQEREYNKQLQKMVDNWRDDAVRVSEIGEGQGNNKVEVKKGKKKHVPLEDITRFTMVKRIW
ncbi:DUF747-domain-containing protein [Chiua virens]|nr:DUF747-domain-containing protein [Chiua virens]